MPAEMSNPLLHVAITGAAGQIAYSLLPSIANGSVFGRDQHVVIKLLDIPAALQAVEGVVMEIEDCSYPLVKSIVVSSDPSVVFDSADYIIMLGAMPRKEGMDRSDLLKANVGIFKNQGEIIDKVAKKTAKIVVVGNPANTNALVCQHFAKSIPAANFSALTRLDENRAYSLISRTAGIPVEKIRNVVIWGNHSNTQYPDLTSTEVFNVESDNYEPLSKYYDNRAFIEGDFINKVSMRGSAVIAARKLSSAMSAAKAICDHLRNWHSGTEKGVFVSMAVLSDGSYGVPRGLMFSFPVAIDSQDCNWKIVQGLTVSAFSQKKLNATIAELENEKSDAFFFVAN